MSAVKADPNLTICAECGAMTGPGAEYHPYAFCVLVKAGLNPMKVVRDAVKAIKAESVADRLPDSTLETALREVLPWFEDPDHDGDVIATAQMIHAALARGSAEPRTKEDLATNGLDSEPFPLRVSAEPTEDTLAEAWQRERRLRIAFGEYLTEPQKDQAYHHAALLASRGVSRPIAVALADDASGRPFVELLTTAADMLDVYGGGPVADCLRLKADDVRAASRGVSAENKETNEDA